jgi:regulator of PEP synthase PpsR (kinase-PPPase family)
VEIVKRAHVRSAAVAARIVRDAARRKAVVCHTLVAPAVREAVGSEARRYLVPAVDLLGPVITVLADHLGQLPQGRPGLLYALERERFDRIDAVDFTLAHDDGCRPEGLADADVVLVGVSRSSKSATCFFLAYRGVRAANVPLVLRQRPPPELLRLDRRKIIGLTMSAQRLAHLREARSQRFGRKLGGDYADLRSIQEELRWAQDTSSRQRWQTIDVSFLSVEETATEVMRLRGLLSSS